MTEACWSELHFFKNLGGLESKLTCTSTDDVWHSLDSLSLDVSDFTCKQLALPQPRIIFSEVGVHPDSVKWIGQRTPDGCRLPTWMIQFLAGTRPVLPHISVHFLLLQANNTGCIQRAVWYDKSVEAEAEVTCRMAVEDDKSRWRIDYGTFVDEDLHYGPTNVEYFAMKTGILWFLNTPFRH